MDQPCWTFSQYYLYQQLTGHTGWLISRLQAEQEGVGSPSSTNPLTLSSVSISPNTSPSTSLGSSPGNSPDLSSVETRGVKSKRKSITPPRVNRDKQGMWRHPVEDVDKEALMKGIDIWAKGRQRKKGSKQTLIPFFQYMIELKARASGNDNLQKTYENLLQFIGKIGRARFKVYTLYHRRSA